MRGLIAGILVAGLAPSIAARGELILQDSLRKDAGWSDWDSKLAFGEMGLSAFGVVSRELEWLPERFEAQVTLDAAKSIIWGFGVAADFSPKTGFSGIALVADRQDKPRITLGRWENDLIVESVDIDAEAEKLFDGVHDLMIGVREDVAYARIDGVTVAKLGFDAKKPAGSQIVLASFAEGDTFFRDLTVAARIPSQGGLMVAMPLIALAAMRRRR
ncbi:MAG: hypothetical protein JNK16_06960 [Phycisphaerales bacterium]|nr:hypothetical protein [Phycisphaerales bacterium]